MLIARATSNHTFRPSHNEEFHEQRLPLSLQSIQDQPHFLHLAFKTNMRCMVSSKAYTVSYVNLVLMVLLPPWLHSSSWCSWAEKKALTASSRAANNKIMYMGHMQPHKGIATKARKKLLLLWKVPASNERKYS